MTGIGSLSTSSSSSSSGSGSSSDITIQEINSLIGYTNTNAVSGLVSGIDTDSIVAKLMESQASPLIKLQQKQQQLEWQRDDYRSMNTLLQTLQQNVQTMKLQSTYLAKTVTSSNSAVATATAGATAGNSTYTLTNVTTATSATLIGAAISNGSFDPTQSLWSQQGNMALPVSNESDSVAADGTVQLAKTSIDSSAQSQKATQIVAGGTTYSVANSNLTFGSGDPSAALAAGQAYINTSTGKVSFGSSLTAGSTVTASYSYNPAMSFTPVSVTGETQTTSADGTTFNLKNAYVDSGQSASITVGSTTYSAANGNLTIGTTTPSTVASGQAYLNATTGQMTFGDTIAAGSTITSNYSYDTVNFTLQTYSSDTAGGTTNSQNFTFSPSTSLNTMMQQISDSNLGINAFYDTATGKISMTRTDTGNLNGGTTNNAITVVPPTGNTGDMTGVNFFNNVLGLGTSSGATSTAGTDATFTLNGLATSRPSNTFTVNGMTVTLQGNSTGPTTLSVGADTNTVTTAINSFITLYNSTISQINSKITEKNDPNYAPLSSIQQAQMSDSDITAWNTKAQQGMLSNDSILSGALSEMRTDIYSSVGSTGSSAIQQLAQIGITVSADYTQNGQLSVTNSQALQSAISTNPQAVVALFTNISSDPSQQGIMQRLNTTLTNAMSQITQKAGTTSSADGSYFLSNNIDSLSDQISAMKTQLQSVESRYYTEFNAMEEAVEQANQQSSYLSSFASSSS